jgi:hypothetical protein
MRPRRDSTSTQSPVSRRVGGGVSGRHFDERFGSRFLKRLAARRLGARVPVVDDASGGQPIRILGVGRLERGLVIGSLDLGAALGIVGAVFVRLDRRSRREIVTIRFAVVGRSIEHSFDIEPLGTARMRRVTGATGCPNPRSAARTSGRCNRMDGRG